ncbi:hypothetical protein EPUL_001437 [Erysiphe pulchra]|uniref:SH3 domain-containing protein n=1 Tax=Erysiphe pulchra TaxID=225359 RepID=A0A2S4PXX5_9PEZI|nr:hypothetical protein EPUL_001437 [Erysiphe pulchra]
MKSMNRQFGKLMRKDPGNRADIATLLGDYEEADKALSKMIEACKVWRDSWVSTLSIQLAATAVFNDLYHPITCVNDRPDAEPAITPVEKLNKVVQLQKVYSELKSDLLSEVKMIESRVIKPAIEAKELIQPARKSIRKRENKRLDLEMYSNRVNSYTKKMKRTERENLALEKAEEEMAAAACTFKLADDHLREILPPIISTSLSILPHLLEVQIMIQTSLLAHYYTALHNYCVETNFQSPPPPMSDVISVWAMDFTPVRKRAEAIDCIARGKAVHQSMTLGEEDSTVKSQTVRNGIQNRQLLNSAIIPMQNSMPPSDIRSRSSEISTITKISSQRRQIESDPHRFTSNEKSLQTIHNSFDHSLSAGVNHDQLQRSLVGKKRPPPPPPPKRITSKLPETYVTALYSFEGENDGDLSFKDGDIIKVTKKTDSTDDWWEGILRGRQGSFPANYCKIN